MTIRTQPILSMLLVLLLCARANGQDYTEADLDEAFARDVLVISTADQACIRFDIHIAVTREQQMRGLMFVRHMPEMSGMIFVYTRPDQRSMWMKNTYIPLDILFVKSNGEISSVAENTEPLSLKSISSKEPVTYVLELNAGTAERFGLTQGAKLILDRLTDGP